MRLTVQLWRTVTVFMGVVVLGEGRVEQREVDPAVVSPEDLIAARSHPPRPLLNRQSWTRGNPYPGYFSQKEPDTSTTYWARRARGRYHSLGASSERRLYTERRATERHESREPQPRRVYPATRNAAARETLPTTRLKSSTGERLIFTVQQNQPASIDNHRQYHHVNDSHGPRVLSSDDMPQQRPQPDRHIGNPYRASSYDNARETPSTNRPVERHLHFRHRDQDIRPRPVPGADLSKVSNATRDFPEGASVPRNHHRVRNTLSETMDEAGNNVRQRLEQSDFCCGSRVPLDPRVALATGAFQRVAAAGSIKVVEVPAQNSFPPNEVRDLRAESLDPSTLSLTWTAPGDDLDSGTASGYIIRLSEDQHNLQESHFDAAPAETLLETSESLVAAGVYQTAGTRVVAKVPLKRQLEQGQVYYVALKALDNDGHSSNVSNVARFSVPESLTEDNMGPHQHATVEHYIQQDSRLEELSGHLSQGTAHRHGELAILAERTYNTPSLSSNDTPKVGLRVRLEGNSRDPTLPSTPRPLGPDALVPDGPAQQKKRNRNQNRRRKKNKAKRRKNGRRRNSDRQGKHSDTSV